MRIADIVGEKLLADVVGERLSSVMKEHEVSHKEIVDELVSRGLYSPSQARAFLDNLIRLHIVKNVTLNVLVVFAVVCNCTTDYLVGLSDRVN